MLSTKKRYERFGLAGTLALAAAVPVLAAAGTLAALSSTAGASCSPNGGPASSTTVCGTVTLSGGSLQLSNSGSLSWTATITGLDQAVVDTNTADTGINVDDATGSGNGWHVTASQTQFSDGNSHTLPFLILNGSSGSATDTTALNSACFGGNSCTNAANSVSAYPLTLSASASTIFSTPASTGIGSIGIGTGTYGVSGNNPVSWWVSIPASAIAATYTSTITEAVVSGP